MRIVRLVAMITLLFLGASAIFGAVPLLIDPTGELMHMPLRLLRHSPFSSFLVPAIILLVANGFLSLWVFWLTFRRYRSYASMVLAQGCVLLGWLIAEVILLQVIVNLHYFCAVVALILLLSGVLLRRGRSEVLSSGKPAN